MSWRLASFGLLAAVLIVGFVWYERSRPSSRVVALVAVLAALAVAGRIALAPIPNVVATTDVALLAGYSLGAAPGFAVGSIAALVSNFWLGQGPWTPWQMAAWGTVGIGGALLARLAGRRLGRLGLAAAGAAAGLAYGLLLDLSVMVNYGGEQSLERYLALSARGIPFNVVHALGNAALMLVAGPAMVAMLDRFRKRSRVVWRDAPAGGGDGELARVDDDSGPADRPLARAPSPPPGRPHGAGAAAIGAAIALCVAACAVAPSAEAATPERAARWLAGAQNRDGGFGIAPGEGSGVAMTGWAALGLESAGRNPLDVRRGGNSPIAYLRRRAGELRSNADLERTMLVLAGAGRSARRLGSRDLLGELRSRRRANGSWDGQVNQTAFGILALRAAGSGRSAVRESARWVRGGQNPDGGWGSRRGSASEPDSTGAAIQALAVAPGGADAVRQGSRWLHGAQRRDGGWALAVGAGANSQSTAWAVQGLLAAGEDPRRVRNSGKSGLAYLAARQRANGSYRYSKASDQTPVWVTAQALAAVERRAYPIDPVARARAGQRGAEGSGASGSDESASGGGGSGGGGSSGGDAGAGGSADGRSGDGGPSGDPEGGRVEGATGSGEEGASGAVTAEGVSGGPPSAGDEDPGVLSERNLLVGLAALAAALGGGFLWYRRRLP